MTTQTLTSTGGTSSQGATAREESSAASEEYRELWTMTPTERVAAMWRAELTIGQLCQWSSRASHEVPLLAGEFAWIVMRTPDWAEASHHARTGRTAPHHQDVAP